jgi:hypothetical protein
MVLTVSFALSSVTGLVCHRRQRSCLRKLDASVGASGPHDFAVRVSAARLATLPRPPHPAPTSVTIAIRPSYECGTWRVVNLICPTGKAKYFCKEGWTAISQNSPSGKSVPIAPHEPTGRAGAATASDDRRADLDPSIGWKHDHELPHPEQPRERGVSKDETCGIHGSRRAKTAPHHEDRTRYSHLQWLGNFALITRCGTGKFLRLPNSKGGPI